ncbi:aminotransferase class III-fold pyridoxal phosphate-dependent enzyme [Bacillus ginsengihumi]|uniref:Aminotransferase class III-fold pyridoxal phosphate-dependent enzyme n=1 Tax=Heyndrickxia ginsengihumi TaxID=363870 RepID=A0A6M0PC00_9BACI|nr:aminotransferase class III-fold pyridoxal phosphate-dependent enzyme [Heyndrickxia ginsengihumi]NEY21709.1 aminotransferase class III-fold pyridoxal phosphate-dependent enzyme [Heyndrickxia ginsengihumi]
MSEKNIVLNGNINATKLHNININYANDSFLYDENNEEYIDLNSGLWNVSLGYNNGFNRIIEKGLSNILNKNLPYLDISSYNHYLYERTATKILNFVGKGIFEKVFYTNSGSESLELSLKIARAISSKKKIVTLNDSYHGTYYGGMALSGITKEFVKSHEPDYREIINLDLPITEEKEKEFFEFLMDNRDYIGIICVEPVISSGGIKFANSAFYNRLMKFCNENEILTIFDEVATGFYKTKYRFFIDKLEYSPDILCLSKGINNGVLPTGAVLINEKVYSLLENITAEHFSTQNGNLLCIQTIFDSITYYEEHDNDIKKKVENIESLYYHVNMEFDLSMRIIGLMCAVPVNKINSLNTIMRKLKDKKILTYCFETGKEQGLIIVPNIYIDIDLLKRIMKFIAKTVKKYD